MNFYEKLWTIAGWIAIFGLTTFVTASLCHAHAPTPNGACACCRPSGTCEIIPCPPPGAHAFCDCTDASGDPEPCTVVCDCGGPTPTPALPSCKASPDLDGNGVITVDEILHIVGMALDGCTP